MRAFETNRKRKYSLRSKVTWPPRSPFPVTKCSGAPALGEAVSVQVSVLVGDEEVAAHTGPSRAASCPPDIAGAGHGPEEGAGQGMPAEEAGVGGDVQDEGVGHQDEVEAIDVLAAVRHGGRPPQPDGVEPGPPMPNPDLQKWVRVRRRITPWRLACHSDCGRVCAVRRQRRN